MNLEVAKNEALSLMQKHGLLDLGWRFEFDTAKRRFGCCNYSPKKISLSKHLTELNEIAEVKNIILHEIAHALVGYKHGHDSVWKQKALEIGCDGNRCYSYSKVNRVQGNYIATCGTCSHTYHRFKRPKGKSSCGKCSRGFNPNYLLNFEPVKK